MNPVVVPEAPIVIPEVRVVAPQALAPVFQVQQAVNQSFVESNVRQDNSLMDISVVRDMGVQNVSFNIPARVKQNLIAENQNNFVIGSSNVLDLSFKADSNHSFYSVADDLVNDIASVPQSNSISNFNINFNPNPDPIIQPQIQMSDLLNNMQNTYEQQERIKANNIAMILRLPVSERKKYFIDDDGIVMQKKDFPNYTYVSSSDGTGVDVSMRTYIQPNPNVSLSNLGNQMDLTLVNPSNLTTINQMELTLMQPNNVSTIPMDLTNVRSYGNINDSIKKPIFAVNKDPEFKAPDLSLQETVDYAKQTKITDTYQLKKDTTPRKYWKYWGYDSKDKPYVKDQFNISDPEVLSAAKKEYEFAMNIYKKANANK